MKKRAYLILSCCLFFPVVAKVHEMTVKTSVADIRAYDEVAKKISATSLDDLVCMHKKKAAIYKSEPSIFAKDNPGLLTQVLFGERVLVEPWDDDWYKVQIPAQKVFYEEKWQPCFGFIRAECLAENIASGNSSLIVTKPWACLYKHEKKLQHVERLLSIGTYLAGIQKKGSWWIIQSPLGQNVVAADDVEVIEGAVAQDCVLVRRGIVEKAKSFLGCPYVWGGGSAWKNHAQRLPSALRHQITGVDCSNLISLSYRVHGLLIPRNSHSQWLAATALESGDALQPGDLIFFADSRQKPLHMNHVVMCAGQDDDGNDLIIESNGRTVPFGVRVIATSALARLENKSLRQLHNGQEICWRCDGKEVKEIIYLGSFLTADKMAALRREFLRVMRGDLVVQ